jgi:hypothetical protein
LIADNLVTQAAATISFTITGAALYPADWARVQAELDTVVGRKRRKRLDCLSPSEQADS